MACRAHRLIVAAYYGHGDEVAPPSVLSHFAAKSNSGVSHPIFVGGEEKSTKKGVIEYDRSGGSHSF